MTTNSGHFIGKDRLIKLMLLSPGFIIGIWRVRKFPSVYVASVLLTPQHVRFLCVYRVRAMSPSSWSVCTSTSWWRRVCWDLQSGRSLGSSLYSGTMNGQMWLNVQLSNLLVHLFRPSSPWWSYCITTAVSARSS